MNLLRALFACGALTALLAAAPASSRPASQPGDPALSQIAALYKVHREKQRAANKLLQQARTTEDRDLAASVEAKAKTAQAEADVAQQKFEDALRSYLAPRLRALDDKSFSVRERATEELLRLGPWAIRLLNEAIGGKSEEVKARLKLVMAKLGDSGEDEEGRVHQWASDAKASSQYSDPDWSAKQATGKPDTMQGGDIRTAWASTQPDGGEEWLELTYEVAVHPLQVRVRETYNPGAVVKVEAKDAKGEWHILWKGKDNTKECPGWLEVSVTKPTWTCRVVKITLDTASVAGWNEIDAVELVGEQPE